MKKFLIILVAALMASAASAQLVTSRTFSSTKKERNSTWFVRAGMSINSFAGYPDQVADHMSSAIGYDISFGFNKPIASSPVYWGMDLDLGTRGVSKDKESYLAYNILWSPVTFGYKYALNNDMKLDLHAGMILSYDFAGEELYNKADAGLRVGLGYWYKSFNFDFAYQRGFVPVDEGHGRYEDCEAYSSIFMIRIGYGF